MASAIASTVRVPTPDLSNGDSANDTHHTRKRSPASRSPSPARAPPALRQRSRSRSPPRHNTRLPRDVDRSRAEERARQFAVRQRDEMAKEPKLLTAEEKQASAKAEYNRLLNMRSGGTYIPPARLRALQEEITDKTSKEYQRMAWESLKKSINGLVNKVNVSNIKHIVPELFNENLIRGRGLFCRSIMKAQAASISFTPVYAAMAAVVNTKLPQVGELLVNRLITQWQKAYKRNDKSVCLSASTFLAHLANQQVVSDLILARMLTVLLTRPTDDSVEVAVGLMKEVGAHMDSANGKIAEIVYDQFRTILHNGEIEKRTQYMIEVLYQIRKDGYKNYPAIKDELDIVIEEDQITHMPDPDEKLDVQDGTNIFKFDPEWEASEEAYRRLKAEILGEASDSEDEDDDDDAESEEDEEDAEQKALEIKDQSNTDLVNLRKTIYLTLTSSLSYEEACHKLMRVNLPAGREEELPSMIIECSIEGRTFNKFHGLIAERFCNLNRLWRDLFQNQFTTRYETIHRFDSNKLRITAQFFGHLLSTDAISWDVFHVIRITEEDTTSSSRIFIKVLVEELAASMGKKALVTRFKEDELQPALIGFFPTDNAKNTRFSINFFTAIGMGELTEGMREWLKNMPKPAAIAAPPPLRGRSATHVVAALTTLVLAHQEVAVGLHLRTLVLSLGAEVALLPTTRAHGHVDEADQAATTLARDLPVVRRDGPRRVIAPAVVGAQAVLTPGHRLVDGVRSRPTPALHRGEDTHRATLGHQRADALAVLAHDRQPVDDRQATIRAHVRHRGDGLSAAPARHRHLAGRDVIAAALDHLVAAVVSHPVLLLTAIARARQHRRVDGTPARRKSTISLTSILVDGLRSRLSKDVQAMSTLTTVVAE